jgi:hypothetical protein
MHIAYYMCIFFLKAKPREFFHLVRVTGSKLVNIYICRLHYIHMIYQLTFTIKKLAYYICTHFKLQNVLDEHSETASIENDTTRTRKKLCIFFFKIL